MHFDPLFDIRRDYIRVIKEKVQVPIALVSQRSTLQWQLNLSPNFQKFEMILFSFSNLKKLINYPFGYRQRVMKILYGKQRRGKTWKMFLLEATIPFFSFDFLICLSVKHKTSWRETKHKSNIKLNKNCRQLISIHFHISKLITPRSRSAYK